MKGTLTLEDGRTLSVELTEEQAKELEINKIEYWEPKFGEEFYFPSNEPEASIYQDCTFDKGMIEQWTAFRTEEECRRWIDVQKAMTTIRKYAHNKWGKFVPNWNDRTERKCSIFYYHDNLKFIVETSRSTNYACFEYFSEDWHAKEIIEKFDKELKIIFRIQ